MHPRAIEGIRLFNEGLYFEAHEELEAAWRAERSSIRQLYQGILEAGVAYLHIQRGNLAGARKVSTRSLRWLQKWPETCRGADVGQLRRDLREAIDQAERLGASKASELGVGIFKPIRWSDSRHEVSAATAEVSKKDAPAAAGEPSARRSRFVCDRCGEEMFEDKCKIICGNCGQQFDCSDLTLYFD